MIPQIAPQFFTTGMAATLAYYKDTGFDCVGTLDVPPVYAIVARDEHRIDFRLADCATLNTSPKSIPTCDRYGREQMPRGTPI